MFNISKSFIGLEDTALKAGTRINENKVPTSTLPSWAKNIEKSDDKKFEDYDKPLFK